MGNTDTNEGKPKEEWRNQKGYDYDNTRNQFGTHGDVKKCGKCNGSGHMEIQESCKDLGHDQSEHCFKCGNSRSQTKTVNCDKCN